MLPTKGRMQPPRITVAHGKAPRLMRLETPFFLRRWENQPPPSTTNRPRTHGKMLRFPPTFWLKPRPETR